MTEPALKLTAASGLQLAVGGSHKPAALAEDLLTADGFWGGEKPVFLRSMVRGRRPHSHEHGQPKLDYSLSYLNKRT